MAEFEYIKDIAKCEDYVIIKDDDVVYGAVSVKFTQYNDVHRYIIYFNTNDGLANREIGDYTYNTILNLCIYTKHKSAVDIFNGCVEKDCDFNFAMEYIAKTLGVNALKLFTALERERKLSILELTRAKIEG